ncbi:hypothetical protein B4U80_01651, partial [Leptotrombidium deliense]
KRDYEGVVDAFKEAINSYALCEDVFFLFASFYCRRLKYCEATVNLLQALKINPNYNLAHICLENIKSSSIKRWHFSMMNDTKRNSSFKEAIQMAIFAGYDSVLDIGTGCGLLSYFAVKCGAKEVYGCEVNDLIFHICKDILQANDISDKTSVIHKMSTDLIVGQDIPKKATLLVTEIFDSALFGEHCLSTISHAWKKLLDKEKAIVIPGKACVFGALFESDYIRNQFCLNWKEFGNLKLPKDLFICENSPELKYSTEDLSKLTGMRYLTESFTVVEVDFNNPNQIDEIMNQCYQLTFSIKVDNSGRLDAIGVWFDLTLFDSIVVSTRPDSAAMAWEQAVYYFPFGKKLNAGDIVRLNATFHKDAMELKIIDEYNPRNISFSDETIRYLNGDHYNAFIKDTCSSLIAQMKNVKVLDFSYIPLVGLHLSSMENVEKVVVINDCEQVKKELEEFMNCVEGIDYNKVCVKEYENILSENGERNVWDLLIVDFVEPSGLLRSNLLERLLYLKVTALKEVNFKIFPAKITVMGMFVQSNDLVKRSRLLSDDYVDGLKASEFINILETEILQEINLTKFNYASLSDHFELLTINLVEEVKPSENMTEPSHDVCVKITGSGETHAIIFWYLLHGDSNANNIFNTRHERNWNLSAFIVKNTLSVHKGDSLSVKTTFCQGYLRIKINRV